MITIRENAMFICQAQNNDFDCNLVFSLSNDPLVRSASFNTEQIKYADHCEWFKKTLTDKNTLFFFVFADETENDFIGQIRFKRECEQAEECVISLSITEQFRGKHIAGKFMMKGIEEMQRMWQNIKAVVAEVKDENTASNALFMREGFALISKVNTYKLNIVKIDGGGYRCRVILQNVSNTSLKVAA